MYPPEWRARYGEEFKALLEDHPATLGKITNIISCALFERASRLGDIIMNGTQRSLFIIPALLRRVLILTIAVNLCLIVIRVSTYRPLLAMHGSIRFIVEPLVGLLGCGLFALAATSARCVKLPGVLRPATAWGLIGGAILVVHMALEIFGSHIGENGSITLAAMLITFLLWGVAGFVAARATASSFLGLLGGCWSAVVSVLMAVSFGFALMFFEVPSPGYVATWEVFKQSGWSDVHAFSIANSLDSGFTHLLCGLVLGSIIGAIAGGIARILPGPPVPAQAS
jgi:hypothetical protein